MNIAIISNYDDINKDNFLISKVISKTYHFIMLPYRNSNEQDITIDFYIQNNELKNVLLKIIDFLSKKYNKKINVKDINDIISIKDKYDELYVDSNTVENLNRNFSFDISNVTDKKYIYVKNLQECDNECLKCKCFKLLGRYNKNAIPVNRIAPQKLSIFKDLIKTLNVKPDSDSLKRNQRSYKKILIINDVSFFTDSVDNNIMSKNFELGKLLKNIITSSASKLNLSKDKLDELYAMFANATVLNAVSCIPNSNNLSKYVSIHTNFALHSALFIEEEIKAFKPDYIIALGSKAFAALKLDKFKNLSYSDLRGKLFTDTVYGHKCMVFPTLSVLNVFAEYNLYSVLYYDFKYLLKCIFNNYYEYQNKVIEQEKYNFSVLDTENKLNDFFNFLKNNKDLHISIDIETNSLKFFKPFNSNNIPKITVISFSMNKKFNDYETILVPFTEENNLLIQQIVQYILSNKNFIKYLHNMSYDLSFMTHVFKRTNPNISLANISNNVIDTMTYSNMLNEEHVKGFKTLDTLSATFTKYGTYYFKLYEYKEQFINEYNNIYKEINKLNINDETYNYIKNILNIYNNILNTNNLNNLDLKSVLVNTKNDFIYYLLNNCFDNIKNIKIESDNGLSETINKNSFFNLVLLSSCIPMNDLYLFTEKNTDLNNVYKLYSVLLNKLFTINNIKTFNFKKEKLDDLINDFISEGKTYSDTEKQLLLDKFFNLYKENIVKDTINSKLFEPIGFTQNLIEINKNIFNNLIKFDDKNNTINMKNVGNIDYSDFDRRELYSYAAFDVKATLEAGMYYYNIILKEKQYNTLPTAIINEASKVITQLQSNGIQINKDIFYKLKSEYQNQLKSIEESVKNNNFYTNYFKQLESMYQIKKEDFNILSLDHMSKLFFILNVDKTGYLNVSSKNNIILDEDTLSNIIELKNNSTYKNNTNILHASNIAEKVLEYRKTNKLYSTYLNGLLENGLIDDNFICYPNYSIFGTRTGRLSSNEPNLQNVPSTIKEIYVSRFDNEDIKGKLIQADYSQIELRVSAMYSICKNITEAFKSGEDIHLSTAKAITRIPYLCKNTENLSDEEKTKLIQSYTNYYNKNKTNELKKLYHDDGTKLSDEEILNNIAEETKHIRRIAKTINFGIIYGISSYSMAQNLGIKQEEADQFIEAYFKEYPEIRIYMEKKKEEALEKGYVSTYFGRKRHVKNAAKYNNILNMINERSKDPDFLYNKVFLSLDENKQYNSYNKTQNTKVFLSQRNRSFRQAINAPIQSTASDFTFLSLISINHFLNNTSLKSFYLQDKSNLNKNTEDSSLLNKIEKDIKPVICGTVHDSIIIDCPDLKISDDYILYVSKNVRDIMVDPIKYFLDNIAKDISYLSDNDINILKNIRNKYIKSNKFFVPLDVELEIGNNWNDLHVLSEEMYELYDTYIDKEINEDII